jgi:hypothetical protein
MSILRTQARWHRRWGIRSGSERAQRLTVVRGFSLENTGEIGKHVMSTVPPNLLRLMSSARHCCTLAASPAIGAGVILLRVDARPCDKLCCTLHFVSYHCQLSRSSDRTKSILDVFSGHTP